MDKKIVGMKLTNWIKFETPIDIDGFKRLHDEFMIKVDEVCHDLFNNLCSNGCTGGSTPIYEGEEESYGI